MSDREDVSIKTIDILIDSSIKWNDTYNSHHKLSNINKRWIKNTAHLNQAHGTPLIVEQLVSLIGFDSYTSLGKAILEGTLLPSTISKSPIIQ